MREFLWSEEMANAGVLVVERIDLRQTDPEAQRRSGTAISTSGRARRYRSQACHSSLRRRSDSGRAGLQRK
jgi:hypothetical protein